MAIDKDTVIKISKLSRIHVKEEEIKSLSKDLSHIINWIKQLDELDTNDVEPLSGVNIDTLPLRKDEVTEDKNTENILQNAPEANSGFFVVPKVVE